MTSSRSAKKRRAVRWRIIDYADSGISGTRITVGPDIATMTDLEIIDVFNGILAAQERLLAAWDQVKLQLTTSVGSRALQA